MNVEACKIVEFIHELRADPTAYSYSESVKPLTMTIFSDPSIPELVLLDDGEAVLLDAELDAGEPVLLDAEDLVLLDAGEPVMLDGDLVLLDAGEAVLVLDSIEKVQFKALPNVILMPKIENNFNGN